MSIRETGELIIPTEDPSVILRELSPDDARAFFEALDANRDHLRQFEPEVANDYLDERSVREWISGNEGVRRQHELGIWSQGNFVGAANLEPDCAEEDVAEIGYWLDKRHTGRGYATLGVRALTAYAADQYYVFVARVRLGNVASMRVLERAGFERTNTYSKGKIDLQNFELYPHGKDEP